MSKTTESGKTPKTLTGARFMFDGVNYSETERRIMGEMPQRVAFDGPLDAKAKGDLFAFMYGMAPGNVPHNYIVVLRSDDSQSQRHGGIRQYRSFVAYVNGQEVERWQDDEARHDYNSGDRLDNRIANWIAIWEKALGCKAIRGEITNRKRLIEERKR